MCIGRPHARETLRRWYLAYTPAHRPYAGWTVHDWARLCRFRAGQMQRTRREREQYEADADYYEFLDEELHDGTAK